MIYFNIYKLNSLNLFIISAVYVHVQMSSYVCQILDFLKEGMFLFSGIYQTIA